jgi:hypothetical protein
VPGASGRGITLFSPGSCKLTSEKAQNANFAFTREGEVRRIYIPRNRVNKPCVLRDGLPVRAKRIHNFSYKVGAARAKGERTMTEASGGAGSPAEMERRLIQRSLKDEDFRQRLLDDPKGTLEQELGSGLPEGLEVRAVQETKDTIYLVLPSASALGGQGGSLSDQELDAVSGGEPAYGDTSFCYY